MVRSVFTQSPVEAVISSDEERLQKRSLGLPPLGAKPQEQSIGRGDFESIAVGANVPVNVLMAIAEGEKDGARSKVEGNAQRLRKALDSGAKIEDIVSPQVAGRAAEIATALYGEQKKVEQAKPVPNDAAPAPQSSDEGNEGGGIWGTLRDMALQASGGAYKGTGSMVRGAGEALQAFTRNTTAPIINRLFGADYEPSNLLDPAADVLSETGKRVQGAVSDATKEAIAGSSPEGDLFKPSTWSLGKNPSLKGYTALALDVFGGMTPIIAASVLSGGSATAGAVAGGLQGGGAAAEQARDTIDEMAKAKGQDGKPLIEEQSAYYRDLRSSGKSHAEAVKIVKEAAEEMAFLFTTPISAMGGAATSKLIHPAEGIIATRALPARIAGRAAIGAAEEGSQEAAETIATNAGVNVGAGADRSLTDGTFGDFLLGALSGAAPAAVGGALSRREAAEKPIPTIPVDKEPNTLPSGPEPLQGEVLPPEQKLLSGPIARAAARALPSPYPMVNDIPSEAAGELDRTRLIERHDEAAPEPAPVAGARVQIEVDGIDPISGQVEGSNESGTTILGDDGNRYEIAAEELSNGSVRVTPISADEPRAETPSAPAAPEAATPEQPADADQGAEGTITAPSGNPFPSKGAAMQGLKRQGRNPDEFELKPVDGGFVASPSQGADYTSMDREGLEGRLSYLEKQAKANGGWGRRLSAERAKVQDALAALGEGQQAEDAATTDTAAHEAATSPTNDRPEPTQAQKEAGNYKLGHLRLGGLDISVENPQGSERKGVDPDGKAWSVQMKHHYGYIKGTVGRDKDHVDVFVRPGVSELGDDAQVFVIDQNDPATGKFDEHKVMLGYDGLKQAERAYLSNYTKGWKGIGGVTQMTLGDFREWVKDPQNTSKPARRRRTITGRQAIRVDEARRDPIPAASEASEAAVQPHSQRLADEWHASDAEAAFDAIAKVGERFGDAIPNAVKAGASDKELLSIIDQSAKGAQTEAGNGYVVQVTKGPKVTLTLIKSTGKEEVSFSGKKLADELRRVFPKTVEELRQEVEQPDATERAKRGAALDDLQRLGQEFDEAERGSAYGSDNTFVTADRAEELRKRLRAKLRGQLNAGVDPEVLAIGAELAAFHIEAGARKFADFARAMARDLDTTVEKIRPYLRAWYNGARDMMEDAGQDIAGTDGPDAVRAELDKIGKEAGDEPRKLDQPSASALEGVPAGEVRRAGEGREAEGRADGRGREDAPRNERAGGRRADEQRGVGNGAREVPVPARGEPGGRARGERSGEDVQRADASPERVPAGRGGVEPLSDRLLRTAVDIPGKKNVRVLLRDLRERVPEVPKAEFDDALLGLMRAGKINLYRIDNRPEITDADRSAAVHIAGEPRHIAWVLPATTVPVEPGANPTDAAPSAAPSSGASSEARRSDFAHSSTEDIGRGGAKTKFRNNVSAIRILKKLEAEGRSASREEQAALAKYVGWGGIPQAFERSGGAVSKGWEAEVTELKSLLTSEELHAAAASTRNAHYTSPEIVRAMWGALRQFGFSGGRVLEPSVGVGNFFGMMPPDIRNKSALHGVELDRITGGVAKQLYPAAKIASPMGFQAYMIPDGHFDVVIGNPPFGAEKLYDGRRKDLSGFSIHNYFFAKSIDGLRPGGVLAMVVTNRMMDAAGDAARRYISDRAELLGAIRLPNDAFLANAGTQVTTDIIFLRKRMPGEAASGESWMGVRDYKGADGQTVPLNEYFHRHPEMMLGDFGAFGSMYRPNDPALVAREDQDTEELLADAIASLPRDVMARASRTEDAPQAAPVEADLSSVRVGSMFIDGDTVKVRGEDALGAPRAEPITFANDKARARVVGMIKVRDAFSEVRRLQLSKSATEAQIGSARAKLNEAYDRFVRANGPINLDANKRLFRDDPSWPQIAALEDDFDKGVSEAVAARTGEAARKPSARKAAVFSKRTQRPYSPPSSVSTAKDALVASLSETGRISLPLMQSLYGKPAEAILSELGDLAFNDPIRGHVTREEYLSGNVKKKLAEARDAALRDRAFARNVDALQAVQPADIAAIDIRVKPGAHWLPRQTMQDFATHVAGDEKPELTYNPVSAKWHIRVKASTEASAKWATGRASLSEVLEAAANQRTITVRDRIDENTTRVNEAETQLANDKVAAVAEEWQRWVWAEDERREKLARLYNDMFNTDVARDYDGAHLSLPGKVADDVISLRPHQANAIWRVMQSGTALLDHVVGAGKTFTMVGAAMELRRTGLAKKPMFAVPNHLVSQWAADFVKLYPGAQVLATTKADFDKENRKRLFARIATGDWDAVIVAHSSFGKVEVEPSEQAAFIEEQIADLQKSQEIMREAEGKSGRNVKQIENQITLRREKMKKLLDAQAKDDSLYWGELGVDALFVDEAHEFKNLEFSTGMQRVAGLGNPSGSQKASDLFLKVRQVLKATGGRNVVFATGTPISNTMAEMFTMQRYLDYAVLEDQGLSHFDAWARMFGEVVTDWELSPSGQYKMNSRFAKFVNIPELMQRYGSFADVVNRDDINRMLAAQGKRLPVPKMKGGKPENVVVDRSPAQAGYIGVPVKDADGNDTDQFPHGSLVWRAENLPKKAEKGGDNMLKIMSDARKAALDMRLISPDAGDYAGSKVNLAAKRIKANYDRWHADKGTQLVFIDLSTPKGARADEAARVRDLLKRADEGDAAAADELEKLSPDEIDALNTAFSVYDDLKDKLIREGIPEAEVAFIHDAKTDLQKAELFAKVRSGRVRVLLGSTAKMGAGTNVQDRLVALHHLDAPWRPSDLEQREGRIIRQGNLLYDRDRDGFEVEVLRYATKQTLDSRMWQTIEGKARFIEQVRKGTSGVREIEDIGGEAANAAEMKAASSGNPLILEEMTLRQSLKRLETERYGHEQGQYRIRDTIRMMRRQIEADQKVAATMRRDAKVELPEEFAITINGKDFDSRKEAGVALLKEAATMEALYRDSSTVGTYGGFKVTLDRLGKDQFVVSLSADGEYQTKEFGPAADPQGLAQRVVNAVASLDEEAEARERRAKGATAALPKVEAEVKDWPKSGELEALKARHREVIEKLRPKRKDAQQEGGTPVAAPKYSLSDLPVVTVPTDEISGLESRGQARQKVRAIVRERLDGKTVTTLDGDEVLIAWQGIKHGTERAHLPALAAMLQMDKLLASSIRAEANSDKLGRAEIQAVYQYTASAIIGDTPASVDIFVRIHADGKRYYDHVVIENKNPSGKPGDASSRGEDTSIQPTEGPSENVTSANGAFKSEADAQAHLRSSAYGIQINKMIEDGRIVVHADQSTLPGSDHPEGRVQAMTGADGRVHVVAANLRPDNILGVLLHEMFHAGAENVLGAQKYARLMKRLRSALAAAEQRKFRMEKGAHDAFWDAALERVERAGVPPEQRAEELAAYAIENAEAAPAGVREAINGIVGIVKDWAFRALGLQLGKVTPEQVRALAKSILRSGGAPPKGPTNGAKYSMAPDEPPTPAHQDRWLRNKLTDTLTKAMPKLLATVPLRPMLEELAKDMPAAREYLRTKQAMDALRNEWHDRVANTADRWLKYRAFNRDENRRLMDIMHESTLEQVDPTQPFKPRFGSKEAAAMRYRSPDSADYQEAHRIAEEDKRRRAAHKDIKTRFEAMSQEAKDLYEVVRDTYGEMASDFERVILDNMTKALQIAIRRAEREHRKEMQRIVDDGLQGEEREAAIKAADQKLKTVRTKTTWNSRWRLNKMRAQFESNRMIGPYFPLARFGAFFVTVRDDTGKVVSFSRFESPAELRKFATEMRRNPAYTVEEGTLADPSSLRSKVDPNFVADVEEILAGAGATDALKDEIWQRYLETLPDFSVRKNRIHRQGRAGFHADAMRAFASNLFHGSHQLARTKFGMDLAEHVADAREQARDAKDPVRAGLVVNEMEKRDEYVMNPQGGALATAINSAAFVYFLAASPASALVNLSQTVMLGVPILGAYKGGKAGMATAAAELSKAVADFTKGHGRAERSSALSTDERAAMERAYSSGVIDKSQAHDLAGIGEQGVAYSSVRQKVMGVISWGFHQTERFNREVTFLAGYRMARANGEPHIEAINTASGLTWKTHFDYQNTSRPRLMHGDMAKVALTFRNYNINMLFRLFRDTHQALNGGTPEERKEARTQLFGITAMMVANAGIKGTWLFGIAMMLAGLFFGLSGHGDDDPEEELQKAAVSLLGPQLAGIALNGLPGHLLGLSLSERIGMPDLWFRSPDRQLEGADAYHFWADQILGASAGIVQNLFRGVKMVSDGHTYRGVETVAPKAIRDLMRAYRYATEGATTINGDQLVETVGAADVLKQAVGFTPAQIAERYELNRWMKNREKAIIEGRRDALKAYSKAAEAGDQKALEEAGRGIEKFNATHPDYPINGRAVIQSIRSKQKARERTEDGLLLNRRLDDGIRDRSAPSIYE